MADDLDLGIPREIDDVDTSPVIMLRQILVVDDTAANLIAAEAALAPLKRTIVTARSGREALARLLEQDFALIFLDINMPDMDGYETARLIRSRERTQHVPIIFMTAHDFDEAAVLRAYELGAVDFLFKPVIPQVLCAKASVFVSLQERTEQLAAERMEHDFENRRRDYETAALRRERDRELAAKHELAGLNDALAETDRRKDSFLAILAHELRNPLAPVRSCIDLIKQDPTRPLTTRMIEILDRQASVLTRLVDDLLDISRIKADKIELRPEHIELIEIVEAAIATSRPHIVDRAHALVLEGPVERVVVAADSVRLTQVFANVINNAARYTPREGRIEIACSASDDSAFVRITDNGVGIPVELQATIFKMFVQERVRSDGSGGLGLGLALSQRLVEMHHGTITVQSAGRGHGTTFVIELPRAGTPMAVPVRKRTGDMKPLRAGVKPANPMRTVLVDDNRDAVELLTVLLEAHGIEVMSAGDGHGGVALIGNVRPDVALVDLGLPGLDGFGVIDAVRARCPDLKTRFVALTGYGDSTDQERTKRAGFHAHLVKPATAATILACLSSLSME